MWCFGTHMFNNMKLLASCQTPKVEDHSSSADHDCLFKIFAANLHIWRLIPPSETRGEAPCRNERNPLMVNNNNNNNNNNKIQLRAQNHMKGHSHRINNWPYVQLSAKSGERLTSQDKSDLWSAWLSPQLFFFNF